MKFNKKLSILSIIVSLSLSGLLTGCSSLGGTSIPKDIAEDPITPLYDKLKEDWEATEKPVKIINAETDYLITKITKIPDELLEKPIENLKLYNDLDGNFITFKDLTYILKEYGINVFIVSDPMDDAIDNGMIQGYSANSLPLGNRKLKLKSFSGKLGELINILEKTYNVSFNYSGKNNIILEKNAVYMSPIPQDKESAEDLVKALENLGATKTHISLPSGLVTYSASRKEQELIVEYLKHFYKNFATIRLQTAVITVNLSKEKNTGFDWASLQAAVGGSLSLLGAATNNAESTGVLSKLATNTTGNAYGLTSEGLTIRHASSSANIQAVFNLLSTYGETNATQSIFLETVSGKKLELKNINEVPYTSTINSSYASNSGSATASGFGTETIDEGLTINFIPYFNYVKNTVTLTLEMDLTSITGYKTLNAGNGNGSVEYPITQKQNFNSVVEIEPGNSHLVGGIMYDKVSDNRANLNALDALDINSATQKYSKSKNALFIMLRPTVTIYNTDGVVSDKKGNKNGVEK